MLLQPSGNIGGFIDAGGGGGGGGGMSIAAGAFDTAVGWVEGTGWSISGGTATHTGGVFSRLTFAGAYIDGEFYDVGFLVEQEGVGDVFLYKGDGTNYLRITNADLAVGVRYETSMRATGTDFEFGTVVNPFEFDDIIITPYTRDVDRAVNGDFATDSDFTKGTGWTIAGGNASHAGGWGYLEQAGAYEIGKKYGVSFDILSMPGVGAAFFYTDASTYYTLDGADFLGNFSAIFTAGQTNFRIGTASTGFSFTNLQIYELT